MKAIGKQTLTLLLALLLLKSAAIHQAHAESEGVTESTFRLILDAPISTWDEALPLGNGMLGGLLWGAGNQINLSLDRGDLWDETMPPEIKEGDWNYANMKKLVRENFGEFMRRYDGTYNHPAPTKLPGGRLVLTLNPANQAKSFVLDMKRAMGMVTFRDGGRLDCFFHAQQRVALIRVDDTSVASKFIRPDGIDRLNYEPAQFGQEDDSSWMVQEASEGLVYATLMATRRVGNQTFLAVAITTNHEDANQPDPLALARSRVAKALECGFDVAWIPIRGTVCSTPFFGSTA
jgi:alpha-L-fucosidase 2